MFRFRLAFRVFLQVLGDDAFAERIAPMSEGRAVASARSPASAPSKPAASARPEPVPTRPPAARNDAPARSEALTLLAVLQREARLVDFLKEPIAGYSDTQVGAAVRDVHRSCGDALERLFALRALRTEAEGATVVVPAGFDAARVRLIGNVTGQPPFNGTLAHTGWEATKVEIPEWTGSASAARVVAPAEVDVA